MPVPTALASVRLPALIGRHQAGHPQGGVGTKCQRIEEVVVDAPVDHVYPLGALSRPHINNAGFDKQIAPFDQLDPELVGQERMLEIGRVIDAGCQQRDRRLGRRMLRRYRFQRRQQFIRIVVDRRDAMREKRDPEKAAS